MSDEFKNCLHVNLRKLLVKKSMTFEALAGEVGISSSTLKGWCEAPTSPRDLVSLCKVAHFFDMTLEELLFAVKPKEFKKISVESKGVVISIEVLPIS